MLQYRPYFTLAPDWVCEVLSPSTAAVDRGDKRAVYAAQGVSHLWFVDPEACILEVLALDGETYRVWRRRSASAARPCASRVTP